MAFLLIILALALFSFIRSAGYFRKYVQDRQKRRRAARHAFAEVAERRKRHASLFDRISAASAHTGTLPGALGDESPEFTGRPPETGNISRGQDRPQSAAPPAIRDPGVIKAKIQQVLYTTQQGDQPPSFDDIVELLQGVANLTNYATAAQLGLGAIEYGKHSAGDDCVGELGLDLVNQVQGWLSEGAPPAQSLDPKKYLGHIPSRAEVDALAHLLLGMVLKNKGHLKQAIEEHREAIRLKPDFAPAHGELGTTLLDSGEFESAALACREAIRLQPNYVAAIYHLGNALYQTGDFTGAIVQYREAIRLDPQLPEPRNNLANTLFRTHDLNAAIVEFRALIQRAPNFAEARCGLANTLYASGDADGAIRQYREAIRLKPGSAGTDFRYNLANTLKDTGAHEEAVAEYREAIKLRPDFSGAHLNLGVALADKGELDAAIAEFQEVLRLQPRELLARQNLEAVMALKERTSAAPEIDREARKLASEFISFKRGVHRSFEEYDRRNKELLDSIAALGADAIPALEQAIFAVLDGFPSLNRPTKGPPGFTWPAFEFGDERAAGMLSETIGRIGSPRAFPALERILSVRTNIHEYHRDVKPGAMRGLAYLAGSDERARRIVTEFAMEHGRGVEVNPILVRAGAKTVLSSDVMADNFLKAYHEKRQSLLDYVRSLVSENQKTKVAALYQASSRLRKIGEKQAALRAYLALLHVDPINAGGVEAARDLLDLEKGHPLEAPIKELHQAAFKSPRGAPTARHKQIVQMIKEHVLHSDPGAKEVCDAACQ